MNSQPHPESLEPRTAPATLALGTLDGLTGSRLSGGVSLDEAGGSVSDAGDVNGDGFDDLIVGAHYADPHGEASGAAYVIFGTAGGLPPDFNLASLTGANGFRISGEFTGDEAGISVSAAGDVNGDSFDDVIVGARGSDSNGFNSGSGYVVFGKAVFAANLDLSTLTGANGFKLLGAAAGDLSGSSVSGAGDLNSDGFDDVIIGAPAHLIGGSADGAAYVVFGKAVFGSSIALAGLTGANGFAILGKEGNAGASVSDAGDVNSDGFDDVLIGAPGANSNRGVSTVIFGKAGGFPAAIDLALLGAGTGSNLNGLAAGDLSGASVSGAGDVNGDGFDDVLIGAKGAAPRGAMSGAAYVVFGRAGMPLTIALGTLNGSNGFRILGGGADDQTGFSVSAVGDFNKDGRADLLIGAPDRTDSLFNPAPAPGQAFLLFGKAAYRPYLSLASFRDADGIRISGEAGRDLAGFSVSAAGDFNGDGASDLLIGAPGAEHSAADTNAGAAYLVYGQDFAKLRFSSNGRIATFGDTDGDLVTVRVTGGDLTGHLTLVPAPIGFVFQKLDLTDASFRGTNVSISARRPAGGSGDTVVNLGALDSTGHDLGTVAIDGDLGQIDAGETLVSPAGVRSLSVGSLGTRTDTQPPATPDPVHSQIAGSLGSFRSAHDVAGILDVETTLGSIRIGGSLDGTAGGAAAGLIRTGGGTGPATVASSVLGGATLSGILSGGKLGKVSIAHDLSSADPAHPVLITALGKIGAVSQRDTTAIASVSIGGSVLNARILAGFTPALAAMNGDAAIGGVVVRGSWSASDLVAGARDTTADGFGQNDGLIPGHDPALTARIASITILGAAIGSPAPGDHFGLVAEQIVKARISGVTYVLTPAPLENYLLDGANNDFRIEEVV